MPTYIQYLTWTDQGRKNAGTIVSRVAEVSARVEAELGVKIVGAYLTMGRFDQVVVCEAPDDAAMARVAMMVAERGNVISETVRAFTMEEAAAIG